jgi:hypothetical protein
MPLVGAAALRVADLAEARRTPAGCPRQASPAGNRLGRGSPGGVWARDIPLYRRAVPGQRSSTPTPYLFKPCARRWPSLSKWHGEADARLDQLTPCLQSQIEKDRDLGRGRTAQVMAAVVLSVGVRWGPAVTAVNGTLIARPARTTLAPAGQQQSPAPPEGEANPPVYHLPRWPADCRSGQVPGRAGRHDPLG